MTEAGASRAESNAASDQLARCLQGVWLPVALCPGSGGPGCLWGVAMVADLGAWCVVRDGVAVWHGASAEACVQWVGRRVPPGQAGVLLAGCVVGAWAVCRAARRAKPRPSTAWRDLRD